MAGRTNRKVVLARRPVGLPKLDDFRIEEEAVSDPASGEAIVAIEHLSIDPFIRTSLEAVSYHPPVPIGGTISALGVGRVLESAAPELKPGDAVFGPLGAQTLTRMPAGAFQKLDEHKAPATAYLGALGLTAGVTSYFGIREVGQVKTGETVVVSAAAGAVGSIAAQIAKIDGARVIGIAGGPHKTAYLTDELGLAGGIDYKNEDVAARLRELAPEGVDVFFDNVGGEQLDIVLDQIRERARVVICGAISQYQNMGEVRGPALYLRLAERHARMEGFAVTHFAARFAEAESALSGWLADGTLRVREHVEQGIESFPATLIALFAGDHIGKLLVRIS